MTYWDCVYVNVERCILAHDYELRHFLEFPEIRGSFAITVRIFSQPVVGYIHDKWCCRQEDMDLMC